jgi:hypothetical protein
MTSQNIDLSTCDTLYKFESWGDLMDNELDMIWKDAVLIMYFLSSPQRPDR